jgi:predicted DCC family thiol-disulfide oxidoreductase YuxK
MLGEWTRWLAMNSRDLVLLSTDHCTLCDRALDLLLSMPELRGWQLRVVDVADDAALLERYGERLPVLRIGVRELDWPFAAADVAGCLADDA